MKRRMLKKGFTLIELMVVLIILAGLATFVMPKVFKSFGKAQGKLARAKIGTIEGALGRFRVDCGRFPTDEEGLGVLLDVPSEMEEGKWAGPYLKASDLVDPWDNPYEYVAEGEINMGSFDIISFGADGQPGGEGENADIFNE